MTNSAGATILGQGNFLLTYTTSVMTNCIYTSSSSITGANSTRTISFQPSVSLVAGSFLQISLPLWFTTSSANVSNVVSTLSATGITVF